MVRCAERLAVRGIELHRRCLWLAHDADFEKIPAVAFWERFEARSLAMGWDPVLKVGSCSGTDDVLAMARQFCERTIL